MSEITYKKGEFQFIKNEGYKYSTGIKKLDDLIGDGLVPGSVFTINVDDSLTCKELWLLKYPIFLNFLWNNIGLLLLGVSESQFQLSERYICKIVGYNLCKKRGIFVDYLEASLEENANLNEIFVRSKQLAIMDRSVIKAIIEISENGNFPLLFYINML